MGRANLHGDRVVLPTTAAQNQKVVTDAMRAYIQHATGKDLGDFSDLVALKLECPF